MLAGDTTIDAAGRRALELMDTILSEKPKKNGHHFSEAVRCLCTMRDKMIDRAGHADSDGAERRRLEQVNAVISVLIGGHFPLGKIPWEDIQLAREWVVKAMQAD